MNKPTAPAAPAHPLVTAVDLGVRRSGRWLIHDVGLRVGPGEIVTVIGPNGSGKTTLVKAMLGIIDADAGTIARQPDLTVGYVPQRLHLDGTLPLTVARMMRLTGRPDRTAVAAALDRVGIGHLAESEVQSLSGGELQRALVARAIVGQPRLLVLDEPAQGVDFAGEMALYDLISDIREESGCGILMISHDLHVVMAQTDTVVCLNHHVCCEGSPELVARNPEYIRLFGRAAAKRLAVYHHHHDHVHGTDGHVAPEHDGDGEGSHDHGHNHGHRHDHGHA